MNWARARQPEQIEERRRSILAAAAALFAEKGVDQTSLTAIARQSGVSKASIYRYFESREQIFLELLLGDFSGWVETVEKRLAPLATAGSGTVDEVARLMAQSILEAPRLAALNSVLTSVLEKNVSAEGIRNFKRPMIGISMRLLNALHAALPGLSVANAQRFVTYFYMFGSGIYSGCHPTGPVAEVVSEPEFAPLQIDYAFALEDHARLLLNGLVEKN
jgi:AcrR family transcriptional regulator